MELKTLTQKLLGVMVVWNIGQGQWVTNINEKNCRHFDAGGEIWPRRRLQELCSDKQNQIYLSHWDMDHVGGLSFLHEFSNLCRGPVSDFPPPKKFDWFNRLPICEDSEVKILRPGWREKDFPKKHIKNDSSLISELDEFLFPGDSPIKMEKKWAAQADPMTKILILGHHGSRTSTSNFLLRQLPHLKLAIASARQSVYGHPHEETLERLKAFHIPVLRTEDWGNIFIYY